VHGHQLNAAAFADRGIGLSEEAAQFGIELRRERGETVGRDSAKKIVRILDKKVGDLTGEDIAHMKKTNGYISRHLKQKPDKSGDELAGTDWTYSLKNWGHDPLK